MKNNPYVGPRPYERGDRRNFYGRNREARELYALVVSEREVLFYAQSGAGKTSLLNARVVPELEQEGFTVLPVARVGGELPLGVASDAVDNVFVFGALLTLAGQDVDPQTLRGQTLCDFMRPYCEEQGDQAALPILILDQFEEIFTTHRDRWQDAEGFFRQIREALDTLPNLGIVFAMREDHVAELDPYAPLFSRRLRARFRMERLGPKGALAAVRQPAENTGCRYDPDVAERLVDDLRRINVQHRAGAEEAILGPFVEPVQLQVVCRRLWENLPEQEDNAIQWEEVEQYGNVDRALTDFYERALALAREEAGVRERQLRHWFGEQLIAPGGTRGLVLRGERETAGLSNAAVDVLEDQHLIRADVRAGARWYELAHDRLVEPISQSNRAWEASRETPLRTAARRWSETEDASLLYSGTALEEALAWAEDNRGEVESYELSFLEACQKAAQVRTTRRRLLTGGIIVAAVTIVVTIVLALLAYSGQQDARRAQATIAVALEVAVTSEQAAVDAQVIAETRQVEAVDARATAEIHYVEAVDAQAVAETRQVQAESAQATSEVRQQEAIAAQATSEVLRQEAESAKAQAEDQRIVTIGRQLAAQAQSWYAANAGLVHPMLLAIESLRRVTNLQASAVLRQGVVLLPDQVAQVVHDETVETLAFSSDGRWVVSGDADGIVQVWEAATGKEIARMKHEDAVSSVAFSPDGQWVASGGADGTARVWSSETGREVARVEHEDAVWSVAFSPDGQRVASGSADGTARVWEAGTGQEIARVEHESDVEFVAFSPDGRLVVSGSEDGLVQVWSPALNSAGETRTGRVVSRIEPEGRINAVAFSPDGRLIATGGGDGMARVWEALSGREISSARHRGPVRAVAFSPGGRWVVSGSDSGVIQVWEPIDGTEMASVTHGGAVYAVTFSPDGSWVVSSGYEGSVRVWEATSGKEVARMTHEGPVRAVAFSPDGNWVASGGDDGVARVWETETLAQTSQMAYKGVQLQAMAFSPDGRWIASGGLVTEGHYGQVQVWSLGPSSAGEEATGKEIVQVEHESPVHVLAFSPDGAWVASGSEDGTVRVLETATGQEITRLEHESWIQALAFSPNGDLIVSGDQEGTVRVAVAATGEEVSRIAHREPVWAVAFSPDGNWVVSGGEDGTARVTAAATGEEISRMNHGDPVWSVAFSPDGGWVVSGGDDGTARVWNAATGEETFRIDHEGSVNIVAFSPDGRWVASGGLDRIIYIWSFALSAAGDAATGEEIAARTHGGPVQRMAFSPDGQWMVSGSEDRVVQVWSIESGQVVTQISYDAPIKDVAFSPDGRWVAVTSAGTVQLLLWQPEDLIEEACARLPRNLTYEEWEECMPDDAYQITCSNLPPPEE